MQIAVGFYWALDLEWDSTGSWTWSGIRLGVGLGVGFDWELDLEWDSTGSWTWSGIRLGVGLGVGLELGVGLGVGLELGVGVGLEAGTGSWIWSRAGMNDSKSTVQGLSKCLSPTPFDVRLNSELLTHFWRATYVYIRTYIAKVRSKFKGES